MSDIFISYASEDKAKARQFFEAFEKQGWSVFWDRDISTGKSFHEVIDEELAQAKAVVVLWSERSVKKNWVLDEAKVGMQRSILIPVFIEQVEPPLGYRQIQTANLAGWNGSFDAPEFKNLVNSIADLTPHQLSISTDFSLTKKVDLFRLMVADKTSQLKKYFQKHRFFILWAVLLIVMIIVGGIVIVNRSDSYVVEGLKFYDVGMYNEAYPLLRKAAENGNSKACLYIGYMYKGGHVTPINAYEETKLNTANGRNEEAVLWFRKSAFYENVEAEYNLGYMYEMGQGVPQSYDEAVKWYRKAALHDNAMAQFKLGMMYDKGQGISQNIEEAVKWYQKSADQGNQWGQYFLGLMYYDGRGVPHNFEEAKKLYRKSADQGNAGAQYKLGEIYDDGIWVKKDEYEAEKWYRKAAAQGNADAINMLEQMRIRRDNKAPEI